jgi:hypothetical protein
VAKVPVIHLTSSCSSGWGWVPCHPCVVVWVWMAFSVYTCDPRAAARGRGASAFAPSVFAIVPCGCVVSVTWRVLRDRVHTLRVPRFMGLLTPPWCHFREFIIIPLSTLRAGGSSSGAGVGIVVGRLGVLLGVIVLLLVQKRRYKEREKNLHGAQTTFIVIWAPFLCIAARWRFAGMAAGMGIVGVGIDGVLVMVEAGGREACSLRCHCCCWHRMSTRFVSISFFGRYMLLCQTCSLCVAYLRIVSHLPSLCHTSHVCVVLCFSMYVCQVLYILVMVYSKIEQIADAEVWIKPKVSINCVRCR